MHELRSFEMNPTQDTHVCALVYYLAFNFAICNLASTLSALLSFQQVPNNVTDMLFSTYIIFAGI